MHLNSWDPWSLQSGTSSPCYIRWVGRGTVQHHGTAAALCGITSWGFQLSLCLPQHSSLLAVLLTAAAASPLLNNTLLSDLNCGLWTEIDAHHSRWLSFYFSFLPSEAPLTSLAFLILFCSLLPLRSASLLSFFHRLDCFPHILIFLCFLPSAQLPFLWTLLNAER